METDKKLRFSNKYQFAGYDSRIIRVKKTIALSLAGFFCIFISFPKPAVGVTLDDIKRWENEKAVIPLIAALKDKSLEVKALAAQALGDIGDSKAVEPLIATLKKDGIWQVRMTAAWALGKIGDPKAVPPLIAALKDKSPYVRSNTTDALGKIGDRKAVLPLLTALKDNNLNVRANAILALGKIGDRKAVLPLITALKDNNSNIQANAAWALGEIGDRKAVLPLIPVLRDEVLHVRKYAARVLGEIGDSKAVQPLITILKDELSLVREMAEALGKIGDRRAIEPLISALKDEDRIINEKAAQALMKIGGPAIRPLLLAHKDGTGGVLGVLLRIKQPFLKELRTALNVSFFFPSNIWRSFLAILIALIMEVLSVKKFSVFFKIRLLKSGYVVLFVFCLGIVFSIFIPITAIWDGWGFFSLSSIRLSNLFLLFITPLVFYSLLSFCFIVFIFFLQKISGDNFLYAEDGIITSPNEFKSSISPSSKDVLTGNRTNSLAKEKEYLKKLLERY